MPLPTPKARTLLDQYSKVLSSLGDGVTLDDFRPAQLLAAAATARRVRWYLASATLIFIGLALYSLYLASHSDGKQDLFYCSTLYTTERIG